MGLHDERGKLAKPRPGFSPGGAFSDARAAPSFHCCFLRGLRRGLSLQTLMPQTAPSSLPFARQPRGLCLGRAFFVVY